MSARQRRYWWAAGIVGALVAGITLVYVYATNSEGGRQWLLAKLVNGANGAFKGRGTLHVGTLREVGWGNVRLDSVAILDTAGVPVVFAREAIASIDLLALFDRKVHVRTLEVRGVRLDLVKRNVGAWNLAYIISGDTTRRVPGPPGYGDDIRVDAVDLRDGVITTSAPWAPHPIFKGAARDSVIAVRDSLHDLQHTPQGLVERRRITVERLVSHDGIITRPDHKPSSMALDSLRGVVSDPPVRIVAANGNVQWTSDSLRLDLPNVQLPDSHASAKGRVWWNEPGAVRFDVSLAANAALSDLSWVWDVLPRTGRGAASVRMRTLETADDAEYSLHDLDVTSDSSHVKGNIDVVVRPADLLLRNVSLSFTPMRSELLRRLSYGVLPNPIHGIVTGRLVAIAGGPLSGFVIDTLNGQFRDADHAGALSSVLASGTFGFGPKPTARNVNVPSFSVDVRTMRAVLDSAPAVDGVVSGALRVTSADLNAADLHDMVLTWIDAGGNTSRVRGDAQIGYGAKVPTVNATIALDPLSMRALARIDTTLALRSDIRGDIVATGALDSLQWRAALLTDSSSRVTLEGTASVRDNSWRVLANGTLLAFDARAWTGRPDMPVTAVSGRVHMTAAGDKDADGSVHVHAAQGDVQLRQPEAPERPAVDLLSSFSLDTMRLRVDSATMHVGGITFDAHGALLRRPGAAPDTMEVSARADTLELVRRQLTRLAASVASLDSASAATMRSYAADTLRGDASVSGYLIGSLKDFDATLALGARDIQVGAVRVGRVFGSLLATKALTRADFEGVATADEIDGLVGAVRIASAEFRVQQANPDSGRLIFDASSPNDAHFVVRGGYQRRQGETRVVADSMRFAYDSVTWRSDAPIHLVSDAQGLRIDSLSLRSSARGVFAMRVSLPDRGPVQGNVHLDRFPVGEAVAFAMATKRFSGLLSGDATLTGSRAAPVLDWQIVGDSLGMNAAYLPQIRADGHYADKRLAAQATITDTLGGRMHAEARVPVDLTIATVSKRLLSDSVDIDVTADSLRLEALRATIPGVSRVRGAVQGAVMIHGTVDHPVATGTMELTKFSVLADQLGIEPYEGHALIRAAQDSLILESFRVRSGRVSDTLSATGALRFARNEATTIRATVNSNTAILARMRDGTSVVVSGRLDVAGELARPDVSGSLTIPSATIVIDPLGASTALDLRSSSAREYLGPTEIPVLQYAAKSITQLGQFANVRNARVELGNEVWVRTPESTVKLSGTLNLATVGDALVPEGTISANRGQYRLDLGVVRRSFSIDSGTVRFYGDEALAPALDISATNVVRLATGDEIPVSVHIGGTLERPLVTLSSRDPLYASAPESEIISLLIFGAPTFALDGQSQNTVRAVTGVLLPSAGGLVEGALQRLFGLNTVQVTTAGGQTRDELTANPLSVLDNLSITAGKQIGERTFLRINTGLCRSAGQSLTKSGIWAGIAAEYRLSHGFTGQVGVDPGSAPCSRVGLDVFPRLQFGFDLFREWIF